jgi:hypothetical protein
MGLAPGAKLSGAAAGHVEARISKRQCAAAARRLLRQGAPVKPGAAGVKVVIDQVVP